MDIALRHAADMYRQCRPDAVGVRTPPPPAYPLTPPSERHLQCVWFDKALRPDLLQTANGEPVHVIDAGRWNAEAGPDFLDAVLEIGKERRRVAGDVEVHIAPSDWDAHRHRDNPAYARVIAHVTFHEGAPPKTTGSRPVAISLQRGLFARRGFFFESIDTTAYPYAARRADTPCGRILQSLTAAQRSAWLMSAGIERLLLKAERIAVSIDGASPEQALYQETLSSLGYKHNQTPFRHLAATLPVAALAKLSGGAADAAYALLLGSAGLLPRSRPEWPADSRAYARALWKTWWRERAALDIEPLRAEEWRQAGVRPQNAPIRRLAAAAALFTRDQPLSERIEQLPRDSAAAWRRAALRLLKAEAQSDYWSRRLVFSAAPSRASVALIGAERAVAMLTNVFLPYLAARGVNVLPLIERFPREHHSALQRQVANALFGRDHTDALYPSAVHQQGLLQVMHDFCLVDRSGCAECPLPERLEAQKTCSSQTRLK